MLTMKRPENLDQKTPMRFSAMSVEANEKQPRAFLKILDRRFVRKTNVHFYGNFGSVVEWRAKT